MTQIYETKSWRGEPLLRRSALGRKLQLGELYDANSERSSKKLLFQDCCAKSEKCLKSRVEVLEESQSLAKKFQALRISEELQIQVLCDSGIVSLEGSSLFLTESTPDAFGAVLNRVTLQEEWLTEEGNLPLADAEIGTCTHVVVGIVFGGMCILQLNDRKDEAKARDLLQNLSSCIQLRQNQKLTAVAAYDPNEFELFADGDFQQELSVVDPVEFISEFNKKIKNVNSGKGVQLEYFMAPLSTLNIQVNPRTRIPKLPKQQGVFHFQQLYDRKRLLRTIKKELPSELLNFMDLEDLFKLEYRKYVALASEDADSRIRKNTEENLTRLWEGLVPPLQGHLLYILESKTRKVNRDNQNPGPEKNVDQSTVSPNECGDHTVVAEKANDKKIESETPAADEKHEEEIKIGEDGLNILILGKSGVGKSTWINSIVNYLKYKTIDDAEEGGVECVIPASFTVTYATVKKLRVEIGEPDHNEQARTGESATKRPRAYTVKVNERTYNLIDTPGFGDSDGFERDQENLRFIREFICNHVESIHAVCILLKSNETRLDSLFHYCITSVLNMLHPDLIKNIVFCFTHSRASFYSPGDTYSVLSSYLGQLRLDNKVQLNDNTMYCLDNESFRFLCALKHKEILQNEKDKKSYIDSWEKSVEETKRLFDYIEELSPCNMNQCAELSKSHTKISNWNAVIPDIVKVIQRTVSDLQEEMDFVDDDCKTMTNYSFHQTCLNYVFLNDSPMMCTNKHNLDKGCRNFDPKNGDCKDCGCNLKTHNKKALEKQLVRQPAELIHTTDGSKRSRLTETIIKFEKELELIMETATIVNLSVKRQSIESYSRLIRDLKNIIKEEDIKSRATYTPGFKLKPIIEHYVREIKNGSERKALSMKQIEFLENRLFQLKYTGTQLKAALEVLTAISSKTDETIGKIITSINGKLSVTDYATQLKKTPLSATRIVSRDGKAEEGVSESSTRNESSMEVEEEL